MMWCYKTHQKTLMLLVHCDNFTVPEFVGDPYPNSFTLYIIMGTRWRYITWYPGVLRYPGVQRAESYSGFVPGRSTSLQLLSMLDTITDIVDSSGQVDIIYMDFQKAFDQAPHRRLIEKVKSHGIQGCILKAQR